LKCTSRANMLRNGLCTQAQHLAL